MNRKLSVSFPVPRAELLEAVDRFTELAVCGFLQEDWCVLHRLLPLPCVDVTFSDRSLEPVAAPGKGSTATPGISITRPSFSGFVTYPSSSRSSCVDTVSVSDGVQRAPPQGLLAEVFSEFEVPYMYVYALQRQSHSRYSYRICGYRSAVGGIMMAFR